MDDENNTPVTMTNPRVLTNNATVTTVTVPTNRRFFVGDKTDFVILVIHFLAPSATKLFVDVTSYMTIERDLMTLAVLDTVPAIEYTQSKVVDADWIASPSSSVSHSAANRPGTMQSQAVFRRQ